MELPTYTNIWRIEKRLYKLYDFRLPMPLPVGQIAVFAAIAVPYAVALTVLGLPFSHTLLWIYVLPPGALAWLATRPVLESKRLHELVISQVRYLSEPRTWCRMAPLAEKDEITVTARVWRQARPEAAVAPVPAVAGQAALAQAAQEQAAQEQAGRRPAVPARSPDRAASAGAAAPKQTRPAFAGRRAAAAPAKPAPGTGRHAAAAPSGRGRFVPARRPAPIVPAAAERVQASAVPAAERVQASAVPAAERVQASAVPAAERVQATAVPAAPAQLPAVPARAPAAPPRTRPVTAPAALAPPAHPASAAGAPTATPTAPAEPAQPVAEPAQPVKSPPAAPSVPPAPSVSPAPSVPPAPPAARPVVTVTGESAPGRPLRVVERALSGSSAGRADGWRDQVVVVPGGHRPGRPDQQQRDRARAQLPVARSCRIVVLGCTVGAGQTVTTLMTGEVLANLRTDHVAVLDLNPGRGSLAERARTAPAVTPDFSPPGRAAGLARGGPPRAPSRLEVISRSVGDAQAEGADDEVSRMLELVSARYPLTLADPAPSAVPRVLALADQLVLVAPASTDAASAIAMTQEWLEAHGRARLAAEAVTVLNGVSRHTMRHVEQAEAVARGRCRAIVRVPWDDQLRNPASERIGPPTPGPQPDRAGGIVLSPATAHAYTALAGVLIAGLADAPELRRARI